MNGGARQLPGCGRDLLAVSFRAASPFASASWRGQVIICDVAMVHLRPTGRNGGVSEDHCPGRSNKGEERPAGPLGGRGRVSGRPVQDSASSSASAGSVLGNAVSYQGASGRS